MPFLCPECGNPTLEIAAAIELPPDSTWDEIALQTVRCAACGFRAAAVYRESRRGSLDSEAVDHTGYRLPADVLESLVARIEACPAPRSSACRCEAHRSLGKTDELGRWCGLPATGAWFPMRSSSD
ncbi:MAG TPA: hypothetical protein VF771_09830 [Longimicrobiaceae bacterium]